MLSGPLGALVGVVHWLLGYFIVGGLAHFVRDWDYLTAALTVPMSLSFLYIWLVSYTAAYDLPGTRDDSDLFDFRKSLKFGALPRPPSVNPSAYTWTSFQHPPRNTALAGGESKGR